MERDNYFFRVFRFYKNLSFFWMGETIFPTEKMLRKDFTIPK